jgi:type II secretory pathway pseudopilin PulG
LVVVTIISILLALLMPALNQAREAARRAVCENNLHQMGVAMHSYIGANRKFPKKAATGQAGGWSVVILEFLEQRNLQLAIEKNPSLTASPVPESLTWRPMIMSCPVGDNSRSSIATIPVSNYILAVDSERNYWKIGDAPVGFAGPWVNGPEFGLDGWDGQKGPHYGGFYICDRDGSVDFVAGGVK